MVYFIYVDYFEIIIIMYMCKYIIFFLIVVVGVFSCFNDVYRNDREGVESYDDWIYVICKLFIYVNDDDEN